MLAEVIPVSKSLLCKKLDINLKRAKLDILHPLIKGANTSVISYCSIAEADKIPKRDSTFSERLSKWSKKFVVKIRKESAGWMAFGFS